MRGCAPGVPLVLEGVQTAEDAVPAMTPASMTWSCPTTATAVSRLCSVPACPRPSASAAGRYSPSTTATGASSATLRERTCSAWPVSLTCTRAVLRDELEAMTKLCGVTGLDQLHPGGLPEHARRRRLDPSAPSGHVRIQTESSVALGAGLLARLSCPYVIHDALLKNKKGSQPTLYSRVPRQTNPPPPRRTHQALRHQSGCSRWLRGPVLVRVASGLCAPLRKHPNLDWRLLPPAGPPAGFGPPYSYSDHEPLAPSPIQPVAGDQQRHGSCPAHRATSACAVPGPCMARWQLRLTHDAPQDGAGDAPSRGPRG